MNATASGVHLSTGDSGKWRIATRLMGAAAIREIRDQSDEIGFTGGGDVR
jgi:hypothetical protein